MSTSAVPHLRCMNLNKTARVNLDCVDQRDVCKGFFLSIDVVTKTTLGTILSLTVYAEFFISAFIEKSKMGSKFASLKLTSLLATEGKIDVKRRIARREFVIRK